MLYIHRTLFEYSKTDAGKVKLQQMSGFGVRWFDSEAEFRLWAKPYLRKALITT